MFLRIPKSWGDILKLVKTCRPHSGVSGGRLRSIEKGVEKRGEESDCGHAQKQSSKSRSNSPGGAYTLCVCTPGALDQRCRSTACGCRGALRLGTSQEPPCDITAFSGAVLQLGKWQ